MIVKILRAMLSAGVLACLGVVVAFGCAIFGEAIRKEVSRDEEAGDYKKNNPLNMVIAPSCVIFILWLYMAYSSINDYDSVSALCGIVFGWASVSLFPAFIIYMIIRKITKNTKYAGMAEIVVLNISITWIVISLPYIIINDIRNPNQERAEMYEIAEKVIPW